MMTSDIFSTLVEDHHLSEEIADLDQHLAGWINNGGHPPSGEAKYNSIYEKITSSSETKLNHAEIIQKLTSFRQFLNTLPVLEIVVAFKPEEIFKNEVVNRLKRGIKGNFVVKFSTDKDLIAGCKLNFKGRFADYSLLKVFSDNPAGAFGEL